MSKVKLTAEMVLGFPVPQKGRARHWDTVTNGLMVQTTPNGVRSFYCYYRLGGKGDRAFIGDAAVMPLRDARKLTEEYRELARHGKDPKRARKASTAQDGVVRLATVFDAYSEYCTKVRATRPVGDDDYLAPTTLANLTSTMRGLKAEFGNRAWTEITPGVLLRWHTAQETSTRARANTYLEKFRDAWRWARLPGRAILPPEAPSAAVLWEDYKRYQLGKRTRRLSDAEIILMFEAIDHFRQYRDHRVSVHALNYVEMLLLIGSRKGQTAELRWTDDGAGNVVQFKDKVPFRFFFRKTKTGRKYMEFESDLAEVLLRFKRDMIVGNPFVFPSVKDREALDHIKDVRGLLRLLTDHAGIDPLMPHDFRRTNASAGGRAGLAKEDIRKNLNHESVKTTEGYLDPDEIAQAEAAANRTNIGKVTRYIGSLRKIT